MSNTQTIPTWTLGDRLAKARKDADIRSAEMALVLGVSRTTITNYEAGRSTPTLDIVAKWSTLTDVPIDWLAGINTPATLGGSASAWYGAYGPDPPDTLFNWAA